MEETVGAENGCFPSNVFLESLVSDKKDDDDPLMKFVFEKCDSNSPTNQRAMLSQEFINTIPMTTTVQTNPSETAQPLTGNATDSSKKRPREREQAIAPDQFHPLPLARSGTGMTQGNAKKAKSAEQNHLYNQNTDLESNRQPLGYDSCLYAPYQIPVSQTTPVLPVVRTGTDMYSKCVMISPLDANEFGSNTEVNHYQTFANPSFNISSVISSHEGASASPFSTSAFSDEDIGSVYTPNTSQSVQENQSTFICQNPSQNTKAVNSSILQSNINPNDPIDQNTYHFPKNNEPLLHQRRSKSNASSQITSASTPLAFCQIVNPRKEYDKNQKKLLAPRRSEQRIQGGKIVMKISTKIPLVDHAPVKVFVRREPSAAQKQHNEHPDQFTLDMTRISDVLTMNNEEDPAPNYSFAYKCNFDLDSVYLTTEGKEVYKLVKSKGAFNNRFQLCVYLTYSNEVEESLIPYEFVLKSGRTPTQQDHSRGCYDAGMNDTSDGPRAHLVSCRYLDAETARIRNIRCENIETKNHDIAYFMRVRSNENEVPSDMEKGDVVAFLEDEEGDTYITFLTSENAREARLAGVISRTAFFRGRTAICDPDHIDCDLVCVIGEVEVKVVGKVQAGDLIYTSNCEQYRGSAVARKPLDTEVQDSLLENGDPTPTLLGMAMESNIELDIKLVRCLVSIVLGISDLHQRRTLDELRNCHDKIVRIQRYIKGVWKKSLALFMFFLVAGIICYIFLAPNSPYLIMKCEKGCKVNRKGSCQVIVFEYFPDIAQESDEIVGIRFKWRTLKRKLQLGFNKYPNQTKYRYYLNKVRCVTGGIRAISSWLDPSPRIPRVNVLAVSNNCSQVFYYSAAKRHWEEYDETKIRVVDCDDIKTQA